MKEKELEEFKKEFIKDEQEYFKKNLLTKTFYQAMYKNTRKSILLLLHAHLSFVFF